MPRVSLNSAPVSGRRRRQKSSSIDLLCRLFREVCVSSDQVLNLAIPPKNVSLSTPVFVRR